MVMPRDWVAPYPPGPEHEADNMAHHEAWNEYARMYPTSRYYERTTYANRAMWQARKERHRRAEIERMGQHSSKAPK